MANLYAIGKNEAATLPSLECLIQHKTWYILHFSSVAFSVLNWQTIEQRRKMNCFAINQFMECTKSVGWDFFLVLFFWICVWKCKCWAEQRFWVDEVKWMHKPYKILSRANQWNYNIHNVPLLYRIRSEARTNTMPLVRHFIITTQVW